MDRSDRGRRLAWGRVPDPSGLKACIDEPGGRYLAVTPAQYAPKLPGKVVDPLHLLGGADSRFVTAV